MKLFFVVLFSVFLLLAFGQKKDEKISPFSKVEIERLLVDSLLNVRAITLRKDTLYFATSDGVVGFLDLKNSKKHHVYKEMLSGIESSSFIKVKENFRAISVVNTGCLALSVASPAVLYKKDFNKKEEGFKVVFQDNDPKAFYDSMRFWNDKEGIAIGDPIDGCMCVIITRNGGETWTKLPCNILPKIETGEAAFAASNTNIAIVGNATWVASGGKASRVYYSPDKGKTWSVFKTPIIQGLETTGIYSIDFYDELNGFAIGGDYTKPSNNEANKIRTTNGGKTWQLVAKNKNPGYRSCVQYLPNKYGKSLVSVGFKGVDYSFDSGDTWQHLSDEGFYTIRFLNDSIAYAAGAGRIAKLTFKR